MPIADPLISIVIPIYNRFELLATCIQSVIRQTEPRWEALLVNDYSDAETSAFLRLHERSDSRIKILPNQGRKGANPCRNLGLKAARGEFVIFLDSDDVLAPFCLEKRLADMTANPELDFIAYPCLLFNKAPMDRLTIWNVFNDVPLLTRFLQHDAPFQTSGPIWRKRSILNRVEWDEELPGWQDWKFHLEALISGLKGTLHTRIDYFWNAPKPNSISKASHDLKGRAARIQGVIRLARSSPPTYRTQILSSVITLGIRMAGENKPVAALCVYRALKQFDGPAVMPAIMILLNKTKTPLLKQIRGGCRKATYRHYPCVEPILNGSNTYKLTAPDPQVIQLLSALT